MAEIELIAHIALMVIEVVVETIAVAVVLLICFKAVFAYSEYSASRSYKKY